ncbi:MAG: hypothetical protein ACKVQA_09875 [Burkholderiales bacterium]
MTLTIPWYIFASIALVFSIFYGWKACDIFDVWTQDKKLAWKIHQFWLNLAGSIVGWAALWAATGGTLLTVHPTLSITDAVLLLIAFVGITGYLPYAVVGLLQGLVALAKKVAGL